MAQEEEAMTLGEVIRKERAKAKLEAARELGFALTTPEPAKAWDGLVRQYQQEAAGEEGDKG